MSGGDFAQYNKKINELNNKFEKRKVIPMKFEYPQEVYKNDERALAEASQEMKKSAIAERNSLIDDYCELCENINNHIHELQVKSKGGKFDEWKNKLETINNNVSELKSEVEHYRGN